MKMKSVLALDISEGISGPRRARMALVLVAIAVVSLSACGDSSKRALGIERTSPDEFAVVPRAPLSQPPDYKLRPPRPGAEDLTTLSTRERAKQAVFRREGADESSPAETTGRLRFGSGLNTQAPPRERVSRATPGEAAFLSKAGALDTDPLIRSRVDRESAILVEENQNFVRRLLGLKEDAPGEVVDAPAEARRLREAETLGDDPSQGETPTIERKGNSLFKIF
jgi:hypothetical protein